MPADQTMRLPPLREADLDPDQKALYDAIASGPRGNVGIRGPFAVWLHAPAYGHKAQEVGAYCRYGTSIPPRLSEFAILVTAVIWQAQFEWFAHASIAERAGVSKEAIAELRSGQRPASAKDDELAVYDFVHELYGKKRVSDERYNALHALFGDRGMVEFVGLLGNYASVSMTLNVFRVPLPEGNEPPFAEP